MACLAAAVPFGALVGGTTLHDVVFTEHEPNASNPELLRRLSSPLTVARQAADLARSGAAIAAHSLDLATEKFLVYVPTRRPAAGYGLVVFVPPWQDARLPDGWAPVLDRFGLIYVSAARSGNDESVLARREPLALDAAHNVIGQYSIDPARVYIAGFSGGSRIALRLALGYPDLFHGAILNAGSDPIGTRDLPLPPRDLMLAFQSASRVVFVTGERDDAHLADDLVSERSLRQWCAFNVDSVVEPRVGHAVAPAAALDRALGELAAEPKPASARIGACRSALEAELETRLQGIRTLMATGRRADAQQRLRELDARFGGLAVPQSLELASQH